MFTVIEGLVGSKEVQVKLDDIVQIIPNLSTGLEYDFIKSGKISRVLCRCSDGAIQYTMKIFTSSNLSWENCAVEIDSHGQQDLDVSGILFPFISANKKIYIQIVHNEISNKNFIFKIFANVCS